MPITNVQKVISGKSLTLKMENGFDEKGTPLFVSKTFSNIQEAASDANVLNSANVLGSLQNKVLVEVSVQDKNVLIGL